MAESFFLSDEDYKTLITSDELDVIQQSDEETRQAAETQTIEEISSYLRSRYNVAGVFTGETRNAKIVQIACDLTIYTLLNSIPGRFVSDIRVKRRDDAIEWLKGVQKGIIIPDLPLYDEEDSKNPIRFGSNTKLSSQW